MKIIFLDIDGVLNRLGPPPERTKERWNGLIGIERTLVKRFNKILDNTGALVVLSSTWRHDDDWLETMRLNGLEVSKFIGRTPSLRGDLRGKEIKLWFEQNPKYASAKYAIIDDDSDMLVSQVNNFFRTSYITGLTQGIADQVIKYLNE